jgi:serine/threonine protein kinase
MEVGQELNIAGEDYRILEVGSVDRQKGSEDREIAKAFNLKRGAPAVIKPLTNDPLRRFRLNQAIAMLNLMETALGEFDVPEFWCGRREDGDLTPVEYIEGVSLQQKLDALHRAKYPKYAAIVDFTYDMAEGGLEHMGTLPNGIIHRDIKPSNLLRRPDGTIISIDWEQGGTPQSIKEEYDQFQGMRLGTPDFMTPDHIRDDRIPDETTDKAALSFACQFALNNSNPIVNHDNLNGTFIAIASGGYRKIFRAARADFEARMIAATRREKNADNKVKLEAALPKFKRVRRWLANAQRYRSEDRPSTVPIHLQILRDTGNITEV